MTLSSMASGKSLALGEICKDEMGLDQILYLKGISVK